MTKLVALVLLMALPAGACTDDGDDGHADGSAADAPRDSAKADLPNIDRYFPDWGGACDPTDQNCAPGQECTIDCTTVTFACTAGTGGTGKLGDACTVGSCAPGLTCTGTCRKWCREDKDCPAGHVCSTIGVQCPGTKAGVDWLCVP